MKRKNEKRTTKGQKPVKKSSRKPLYFVDNPNQSELSLLDRLSSTKKPPDDSPKASVNALAALEAIEPEQENSLPPITAVTERDPYDGIGEELEAMTEAAEAEEEPLPPENPTAAVEPEEVEGADDLIPPGRSTSRQAGSSRRNERTAKRHAGTERSRSGEEERPSPKESKEDHPTYTSAFNMPGTLPTGPAARDAAAARPGSDEPAAPTPRRPLSLKSMPPMPARRRRSCWQRSGVRRDRPPLSIPMISRMKR